MSMMLVITHIIDNFPEGRKNLCACLLSSVAYKCVQTLPLHWKRANEQTFRRVYHTQTTTTRKKVKKLYVRVVFKNVQVNCTVPTTLRLHTKNTLFNTNGKKMRVYLSVHKEALCPRIYIIKKGWKANNVLCMWMCLYAEGKQCKSECIVHGGILLLCLLKGNQRRICSIILTS